MVNDLRVWKEHNKAAMDIEDRLKGKTGRLGVDKQKALEKDLEAHKKVLQGLTEKHEVTSGLGLSKKIREFDEHEKKYGDGSQSQGGTPPKPTGNGDGGEDGQSSQGRAKRPAHESKILEAGQVGQNAEQSWQQRTIAWAEKIIAEQQQKFNKVWGGLLQQRSQKPNTLDVPHKEQPNQPQHELQQPPQQGQSQEVQSRSQIADQKTEQSGTDDYDSRYKQAAERHRKEKEEHQQQQPTHHKRFDEASGEEKHINRYTERMNIEKDGRTK